MKKWGMAVLVVLFLSVAGGKTSVVYGNSFSETDGQDVEEEQITESMLQRIGASKVQDFLDKQENLSDVSFSSLVIGILKGEEGISPEKVGTWLKETLFYELAETKGLFVQVLVISIAFGILKNFTDVFDNSYISELCFVLVYSVLAVLLMRSFLVMSDLTKETIGTTVEFMRTLIPVYGMSMVFSNGTATAAAFYELTFIILYLVQWLLLSVLLPLVQIMIVFCFMNELLDGEKFEKMTELIEEGVRVTLKFVMSVVVGLNVIQGLIQPAVDKFKNSMVSKTASAIPGIGGSVRAVSEIIVSAGTLVKNSVGVAAMLLLFGICLFPLLKVGVLAFFYKLSAAVVEPVADKRAACKDPAHFGAVVFTYDCHGDGIDKLYILGRDYGKTAGVDAGHRIAVFLADSASLLYPAGCIQKIYPLFHGDGAGTGNPASGHETVLRGRPVWENGAL